MFEIFRDKSRDTLCSSLISLGIDASMLQRGQPQEAIYHGWRRPGGGSLGIIEISEGLVPWINVMRLQPRSDRGGPVYRVVLGIPDQRLISNPIKINIKTVRHKRFPLFGNIVGVTWSGIDHGTGLLAVLSADDIIRNLATEIGNLEIISDPNKYRGWTIQVDRLFKPTKVDWKAIQLAASYVLASAVPS